MTKRLSRQQTNAVWFPGRMNKTYFSEPDCADVCQEVVGGVCFQPFFTPFLGESSLPCNSTSDTATFMTECYRSGGRCIPSHQESRGDRNHPEDLSDPWVPRGHLLLWVLLLRALPGKWRREQPFITHIKVNANDTKFFCTEWGRYWFSSGPNKI